MMEEENTKWLYELLQEVQLEKFINKIIEELSVTRLSHFDYVKTDDLEKIGMKLPAARRLLDHVKKRKRKNFFKKITNFNSTGTLPKEEKSTPVNETALTCLIREKVSFIYFKQDQEAKKGCILASKIQGTHKFGRRF